jgi:Flp pilus assembly pilin Flp
MLLSLYVTLKLAITGLFERRPARLAQARAVTFLEYALMASIALVIFAAIYAVFPAAIKGLFNNIVNAIGVGGKAVSG